MLENLLNSLYESSHKWYHYVGHRPVYKGNVWWINWLSQHLALDFYLSPLNIDPRHIARFWSNTAPSWSKLPDRNVAPFSIYPAQSCNQTVARFDERFITCTFLSLPVVIPFLKNSVGSMSELVFIGGICGDTTLSMPMSVLNGTRHVTWAASSSCTSMGWFKPTMYIDFRVRNVILTSHRIRYFSQNYVFIFIY